MTKQESKNSEMKPEKKATKKPAVKKTEKVFSGKTFKVTQLRSLIACSRTQCLTMEALGLRGRHKSVVIADNAANRGQIMKVQHLVKVEVQPAGKKA